MEKQAQVDWKIMKQAVWETTILFIVSAVLFLISFLIQQNGMDQNLFFNILVILMAVAVIWTDYKILIFMNRVKVRRAGLIFLLLAFIFVVSFQVFYDMLLIEPPALWHFVLFDTMYNLSFCALFVVAFKFTDIYFFNFYNQLKDSE